MKRSKEELQKLYDEFSVLVGAFLQDINERALYLIFEKVIAEINRRKAVKENGKI